MYINIYKLFDSLEKMENKILLIGKDGEYHLAQKNKEGNQLIPSSEKVYVREIVPYGFDFKFGDIGRRGFGICGYAHPFYSNKGENGNYPKTNEEYAKINLDLTINGLEKEVEESGADYIFVDEIFSRDLGTFWEISGRAQLFVKR